MKDQVGDQNLPLLHWKRREKRPRRSSVGRSSVRNAMEPQRPKHLESGDALTCFGRRDGWLVTCHHCYLTGALGNLWTLKGDICRPRILGLYVPTLTIGTLPETWIAQVKVVVVAHKLPLQKGRVIAIEIASLPMGNCRIFRFKLYNGWSNERRCTKEVKK